MNFILATTLKYSKSFKDHLETFYTFYCRKAQQDLIGAELSVNSIPCHCVVSSYAKLRDTFSSFHYYSNVKRWEKDDPYQRKEEGGKQ